MRASAQGVVINEIHYHPASEDAREEFVELHNAGSHPVSVEGWQFTRGVRYTLPAASLPPGGFLVVAADLERFRALHPDVSNVVGGWQGSLSRRGERLELQDPTGATVDEVAYADEGDWAVRWWTTDWLQIPGWEWSALHDGGGRSLELMDAGRENDCGQNWGASAAAGGSPGRVNGVSQVLLAPFIKDVNHRPAVPRSTDEVIISARVQERGNEGVTVSLWHRRDGEPAFGSLAMRDDGQGGDLVARDGVHAATLPPRPSGTVVEFYVEAVAAGGAARRWPALPVPAGTPPANLLYQVDDQPSASPMPFYRIVMTEADRVTYTNRVATRPGMYSNARMNATFISWMDDRYELRYLADVRNRGGGTRNENFMSFRVDFPSDALWHGVEKINLNGYAQYVQILGSAVCQVAGLAVAESQAVQVRLNNWNPATPDWPRLGFYAHNEVMDGDYADRHQLGPANIYRALRDNSGVEPDLSYRGETPQPYLRDYFKETNQRESDWSDLIALTRTLDPAQTSDLHYLEELQRWVAVTNWARFFAVNSLLVNRETTLSRGIGDDYAMYREVTTGQFHLVPWDLDTVLNEGDTRGAADADLFEATRLVIIARFLKHPEIVPLYYQELRRLCDTVFLPARFNALLRQALGGLVEDDRLDRIAAFAAARRDFVLSQIPLGLTVEHDLATAGGEARATTNAVALRGRSHAMDTRAVLVNGVPATWSAWESRWDAPAVSLAPGRNRIRVQALGSDGQEFERQFLDVQYDPGTRVAVAGAIERDTSWEPLGSVREVTGELVVHPGARLTVWPGTTVYFKPEARLVVHGQLEVRGDATGRVRFTRSPGETASWAGIVFTSATADNLLAGLDLEHGDSQGVLITVEGARLRLEDVTCALSRGTVLRFNQASLRVEGCSFAGASGSDVVSGTGVREDGELVFADNTWTGFEGATCALQVADVRFPGPILVLQRNRFLGTQANAVRLLATDAHVEENVFRGSGPDSDTAILATSEASYAPAVLLARNQFSDLRRAVFAGSGAFLTLHNNTFAGLSEAAVTFGPPALGGPPAAGLDGVNNLFHQVRTVVSGTEHLATPHPLSWRWSLFSETPVWSGDGNREGDPRLHWVGERLVPQPGSAALGQGWIGWDIGAQARGGIAVGAELISPTPSRRARLRVWGPGIEAYSARLDSAPFGALQPVDRPLEFESLAVGEHTVEVRGRTRTGAPVEPGGLGRLTWTVEPQAPSVLLSELYAPVATGMGASESPRGWIELVNRGDGVVALAGLGLSDDSDEPYRYRFPAGQSLAAGAFLVVSSDDLGFRLKPRGDTIRLSGLGGLLLDRIEYGPQVEGWSVARDRAGTWRLAWPTPGSANQPCPTGDPAALRLNEWLTRGRTPAETEFVELYNLDPLPVPLGGRFLSDYPGTAPWRQALPALGFVPALGWLALQAGEDLDRGGLGFGLSSAQGVIGLLDYTGEPIDVVWYPPQRSGVSTGRSPDGAQHLVTFGIPGPGGANLEGHATNPPPADVRLSELMADNRSVIFEDGYAGDWIELRNHSPHPANLAGMAIEDGSASGRFVFPPGTWLPAGGLQVWRCDPDSPPSATNTGLGLSRSGDEVRLWHAGTGGLADSIRFGFQAPDVTLARSPTDLGVWGAGPPTPGAPNVLHPDPGTSGLRINEWMARPTSGDDWFELYNPAGHPVNVGGLYLSDSAAAPTGHRLADYSFIGSGWFGYQRLVADENTAAGADHVAFRLSASGESILLSDPGGRLIDEVSFANQAEGVSEGRFPDGADSVRPFPGSASPGAANYLDTDSDGLPDAWEQAHGFNPQTPHEPASDVDGDGVSDLEEFLAGTGPLDPDDLPTLTLLRHPSHGWVLEFLARPGRAYSVEASPQLAAPTWSRVHEFNARGEEGAVQLPLVSREPGGTPAQFYRLVVH